MREPLFFVAAVVPLVVSVVVAIPKDAIPNIGRSVGFLPDCPGVTKNATISAKTLQHYHIVAYRMVNDQVVTRSLPIAIAHKAVANDKYIDLKRRKTMVYGLGFLDSTAWPHTRAVANTYARKGYNVFVADTFDFFTYIYPKSVRLVRVVGERLGAFLLHLKDLGLNADNLELVGVSLGSHVVSHAAKYFYRMSGQKPFRLTGLDPAGPCFRNLPPDDKLNANDANFVDVIHTNIDGFGIAEPLGHVDFYANGGEYQPSDIVYIPCLTVCSHIRSLLYWWIALDHPKKFIGTRCRSVEDARFSNCFDEPQELNYFGLQTNFSKPGVYYLPTDHLFPYYRGKMGLKSENEIFASVAKSLNEENVFVV